MTELAKEDIGRRALLDVLTSATQTPASSTGVERRKLQRFRLKKRLRAEAVSTVDVESRLTRISIVERPSSETVSVCWSDARMGRFSDQIWRRGRARTNSFCLLTGRQIRHGDEIFRPTKQVGLAADQDRMMLACAVDEVASAAYRGGAS